MSLASLRPENGNPFSTVLPSSLGTHERRKRKRRTCCVCMCLACSLIAVAVTLVVLLGIRFTQGNYGGTLEMYPGDTRLVRVPTSYCQSVIVSEQSSRAAVGLFSVNSTPPLVPLASVTNTVSSQLSPRDLKTWRYHVYPGTSVVARRSGPGGFYEIHGISNYSNWVASCSKNSSASCPGVRCHSSQANISIRREEFVYIAVRNNITSSVQLNMSITLHLVGYKPRPSSSNCTTAYTGSCSIPVSGTALISVSITNSSWTSPVLVQWSCLQRVWMYVLLSMPAAIALLVAILALIIHCCSMARRRSSNVPLQQLLGDASELDDDLHGL